MTIESPVWKVSRGSARQAATAPKSSGLPQRVTGVREVVKYPQDGGAGPSRDDRPSPAEHRCVSVYS